MIVPTVPTERGSAGQRRLGEEFPLRVEDRPWRAVFAEHHIRPKFGRANRERRLCLHAPTGLGVKRAFNRGRQVALECAAEIDQERPAAGRERVGAGQTVDEDRNFSMRATPRIL